MTPEHRKTGPVALVVVATALLAALAVLWIVGTVPSGGPDEPSHTVRGAALVRGQLTGEDLGGRGVFFELPAWIGHPSPRCFQLQWNQPATCASGDARPTGEAALLTTAFEYPIWGHLPPGLGTLLPAPIGNQAARLFDAAIPIGLFVAAFALAARRSRLTIAATALAITPMTWFSVIVVNPSGLAIAGGFALWAGLLSAGRLLAGRPDRLVAWTIVAGWAAASLPRRDGAIWAALIVAICVLAGVIDLRRLLSRLGTGPLVVLGASLVASTAWAVTSDAPSSMALALAPLLPVAAVGVRAAWTRASNPVGRLIVAGVVAGGTLVVAAAVVARRPGGYQGPVVERVIARTGHNLEEAIGLLGWLDVPVPRLALFGWFIAIGMLVAAALLRGRRPAVVLAVSVLGVGIITSWILELTRGESAGTYWQGRYYLPLLAGVPMVLACGPLRGSGERSEIEMTSAGDDVADPENERSVAAAVLGAALVVLTLTFGASMRRWALGNDGSFLPWTWDVYDTVVPPVLLLAAHAAVCVALYVLVMRFVVVRPAELEQPVATVTAHES